MLHASPAGLRPPPILRACSRYLRDTRIIREITDGDGSANRHPVSPDSDPAGGVDRACGAELNAYGVSLPADRLLPLHDGTDGPHFRGFDQRVADQMQR